LVNAISADSMRHAIRATASQFKSSHAGARVDVTDELLAAWYQGQLRTGASGSAAGASASGEAVNSRDTDDSTAEDVDLAFDVLVF
jgi:hypothetical protein